MRFFWFLGKKPPTPLKARSNFNQQTDRLAEHIAKSMVGCAPLRLTPKQYGSLVVSSLPKGEDLERIVEEAREWWQKKYHSEVSYNRLVPAFFKAAKKMEKIIIID